MFQASAAFSPVGCWTSCCSGWLPRSGSRGPVRRICIRSHIFDFSSLCSHTSLRPCTESYVLFCLVRDLRLGLGGFKTYISQFNHPSGSAFSSAFTAVRMQSCGMWGDWQIHDLIFSLHFSGRSTLLMRAVAGIDDDLSSRVPNVQLCPKELGQSNPRLNGYRCSPVLATSHQRCSID